MKTGITVINTVQVGMEEYRDVKTTKVFDDSTTILEIKQWVINQMRLSRSPEEIGLSAIDVSDVE